MRKGPILVVVVVLALAVVILVATREDTTVRSEDRTSAESVLVQVDKDRQTASILSNPSNPVGIYILGLTESSPYRVTTASGHEFVSNTTEHGDFIRIFEDEIRQVLPLIIETLDGNWHVEAG